MPTLISLKHPERTRECSEVIAKNEKQLRDYGWMIKPVPVRPEGEAEDKGKTARKPNPNPKPE